MAPAAGLRNILVHRDADIDLAVVAGAVERVLADFPEYVRQVAGFVSRG